MKLIGTFTEAQVRAKEDKAAKEKAESENGGEIRYFVPKFKRRKGQTVMELYGMTTKEYMESPCI